jgi:putative two-component system response regulator
LETRVANRTEQLQRAWLDVIARLGKSAEYRDSATGRHIIRVAHYSRLIALEMHLPEAEADIIFSAAPLHDVGKIGVPDWILLKIGVLTDEERRVMQQHCAVGEKILSDSIDMLLSDRRVVEAPHENMAIPWTDRVLLCAREIAASHHEDWNGGGYPQGLAGEAIPLASRIVTIADSFDALPTFRTYRPALSTPNALQMIFEATGKQFDPQVYKAFVAAMPQIEKLRLRLQDNQATLGTSYR